MNDIDRRILRALEGEEQRLVAGPPGDQALLDRIAESFRTRNRRWTILVLALLLLFTVLAVLCAVGLFTTDRRDTRSLVICSTGFLACTMIIMRLKLWYWQELNRIAIQKDIKRLELRIADLAEGMQGPGEVEE